MSPYPNWPRPVPTLKEVIVAPIAPISPPEPLKPVIAIAPTNIQDAKAAGAVEGTLIAAPLAPSKGPIDAPAESLVTLVVKNFFDTPTWKAVRTVLQAAALVMVITFGNALLNVWSAGKSIFDAGAIDWRATERVAEIAAGPVLVAGLMALMKKKDNNPTK